MNEKHNELTEEELMQVAGGRGKREKTIDVTVYLPTNSSDSYSLEVYVDGTLQRSMAREIDPSVVSIKLSFNGTTGYKQVRVEINHVVYRSYKLNFYDGTYSEF